MRILKDRPEGFLVVSGDDAIALPQMACGMDGLISVAANAYPKEITSIIQYCLNQDFISAKMINDQLMDAYDLMFEENNPAGIKAFLFEMGMIQNQLRLPLVVASEQLQKRIQAFLK
jgi:4-hydroxy-tetrahydrodipicolinate synthase